eukprot:2530088-Pyramimonas_sp.AAC.1
MSRGTSLNSASARPTRISRTHVLRDQGIRPRATSTCELCTAAFSAAVRHVRACCKRGSAMFLVDSCRESRNALATPWPFHGPPPPPDCGLSQ